MMPFSKLNSFPNNRIRFAIKFNEPVVCGMVTHLSYVQCNYCCIFTYNILDSSTSLLTELILHNICISHVNIRSRVIAELSGKLARFNFIRVLLLLLLSLPLSGSGRAFLLFAARGLNRTSRSYPQSLPFRECFPFRVLTLHIVQ